MGYGACTGFLWGLGAICELRGYTGFLWAIGLVRASRGYLSLWGLYGLPVGYRACTGFLWGLGAICGLRGLRSYPLGYEGLHLPQNSKTPPTQSQRRFTKPITSHYRQMPLRTSYSLPKSKQLTGQESSRRSL